MRFLFLGFGRSFLCERDNLAAGFAMSLTHTHGAHGTKLHGRRIIVGVCGGIAAYKAIELVSQLQQAGALVDVVLTEHAEEFVRPLSFSALSHRRVYTDLWEASGEAAEQHIALAE